MAKLLSLLILLAVTFPVLASSEDVEVILKQQQEHGFDSPPEAIRQLQAVRTDAAEAPVTLRARYHNALASLYIGAENQPLVEAELKELGRLADAEQCASCKYYQLIREIQWATRRQDTATAERVLEQVDALPAPADPAILQSLEYVRGVISNSAGDHDAAIGHGIRAAELAMTTGNPAEQVRSLNLLTLANVGRRDLKRAASFAEEGYKLAERIGFTYMMTYVRGNQAWIHSLQGETEKQLVALNDALRISRSVPGMADAELTHLVNLAEYHGTQKDFRKSAEIAGQALEMAKQQKKAAAQGVAMLTLGHARVELGQVANGIETMKQAIVVLEAAGAQSYVIDALNGLAGVYAGLGRHREAFESLQKATALKETAITAERDKVVSASQVKFSAQRKDHEIERLSLENARKQAEVSARTWQQRLWAAAALAMGLGGILLIQVVSRMRNKNKVLEVDNATLSEQSVHDPLTGLYNRRHCHVLMSQQEALIAAKSRDRKYKSCVGLMLLDIDHFKRVNDTYGHSAGDAVLVEVARRLQDLVRQQDTVVRWGGEEFVLVLPGTASEGIAVLAQRVLNIIGSEPVVVDGVTIPVTASLGCAAFPLFPGQNWEDSLQTADYAMYMAKKTGRNLAVCLMAADVEAHEMIARGDLEAAQEAGQAVLKFIEGPKQWPAHVDGLSIKPLADAAAES